VVLADALRHYTAGPTLAVQESDRFGRISVGHHADFAVLSKDPFAVNDPMQLLDTAIDMTVVGGEVVYERTEQ
jgi:predicted amidohydrolase YtcJ